MLWGVCSHSLWGQDTSPPHSHIHAIKTPWEEPQGRIRATSCLSLFYPSHVSTVPPLPTRTKENKSIPSLSTRELFWILSKGRHLLLQVHVLIWPNGLWWMEREEETMLLGNQGTSRSLLDAGCAFAGNSITAAGINQQALLNLLLSLTGKAKFVELLRRSGHRSDALGLQGEFFPTPADSCGWVEGPCASMSSFFHSDTLL